jgi:hypothetical protein
MSTDNNSPSIAIPFAIIAISLVAFLGWQSKVISDQRSSVQTAKSKLEEAYTANLPKLDEAVEQSKKSKAGLEKLALEIIELGKTDADAKAIAAKYVQSQKPAAPASDKK